MVALAPASPRRLFWLCLGLVTLLSFFTYFYRYTFPRSFYWDENYHVAAAQKYLNGVYFMEPHPPLGKLLIAAGEALLRQNERNDQFIGTDYASNPPGGFSLVGYRFFPAMLAWLAAPLLFLIFLLLSRNPIHALLYSFLYVFENAFIVQLRGAMLEGPLIFFSMLTVLSALLAVEWKNNPRRCLAACILFGVALGCAVTTKVFSLIFGPLALLIAWSLWKQRRFLIKAACLSAAAFFLTFSAVWYFHIAQGARVVSSLSDNGYYQASEHYKSVLAEGRTSSLLLFPRLLRDHLRYVSHYESGVPALDLCKDDENGSHPFFWPIGSRTISYRWETPDSTLYQYLYLVPNPAVWGIGLVALLLTVSLLLADFFLGSSQLLPQRPVLVTLLVMYVGFMGVMSQIDRVLYLYHYFLPLLFTLMMLPLCVRAIRTWGPLQLRDEHRSAFILLLAILTFGAFQVFRPLTYYEPISDEAFELRNWNDLWEMRCARCSRQSKIATPHPPPPQEER
ncbi:MAG: hypothetical protein G01um101425_884 [Candidatus Peregrinibacteria bacterium Gr01-1014_25]|nr:MAG: hypothetical protein G01um101425_884 [Candidatus Peregrinibacteria bacterium Gr01-1014_25]